MQWKWNIMVAILSLQDAGAGLVAAAMISVVPGWFGYECLQVTKTHSIYNPWEFQQS